MRPRFFKRGKNNRRDCCPCRADASMRPRFFKRGKMVTVIVMMAACVGFNEATLFQAWKVARLPGHTFRQAGFNEATLFQAWKVVGSCSTATAHYASMRPRFFKRGKESRIGLPRSGADASMRPRFFKRGKKLWASTLHIHV